MIRVSNVDEMGYYNPSNLLKENCLWNVVIGERSNGKTTGCLLHMLRDYIDSGYKHQGVLMRREATDFKDGGKFMFTVVETYVKDLTHGKWTGIEYKNESWFLYRTDANDKIIRDSKPFCYAMAISSMVHYKSRSYGDFIRTIVFDEFLDPNSHYLKNEWLMLCNNVSTVVRNKAKARIFLIGNTVDMYGCPYFKEWGIKNVGKLEKGDIQVYKYGENGQTSLAIQMSDGLSKKKDSDVYFAFDNPNLKMITDGAWQIVTAPHLPDDYEYDKKDIVFQYFIKYDDDVLHCECITRENEIYTYIHRKTSPLKDTDHDLIYDMVENPKSNYRTNLLKPFTKVEKKIKSLFDMDKVFYQDNEVGEEVKAYLRWCKQRGVGGL